MKTWIADSQEAPSLLGVFSSLNDPVILFYDGLHTHIPFGF